MGVLTTFVIVTFFARSQCVLLSLSFAYRWGSKLRRIGGHGHDLYDFPITHSCFKKLWYQWWDLLKRQTKIMIYSKKNGGETWCFLYGPQTKFQSAKVKNISAEAKISIGPKQSIGGAFFIAIKKGVGHYKFFPDGQMATTSFVKIIRCLRDESTGNCQEIWTGNDWDFCMTMLQPIGPLGETETCLSGHNTVLCHSWTPAPPPSPHPLYLFPGWNWKGSVSRILKIWRKMRRDMKLWRNAFQEIVFNNCTNAGGNAFECRRRVFWKKLSLPCSNFIK